MLRGLTHIANHLDEAGFHRQADEIDALVIKLAGNVGKGTQMFIEDLKAGLARAVSSEDFPALTEETVQDVNRAIDELAQHGRFYADAQPDPGFYEEMKEGVVPLVRDALGLEGAIRELHEEIKGTNDPNEQSALQRELDMEQKRYDEFMEEIDKLKFGERQDDLEKYEKFKTMLNQRRKELGWE